MRAFVVLLSILCEAGMMLHAGTVKTASRPFTVRDGIEMTMFSDPYTRSPDAQCQVSPDGSAFFVVTTRGILATDQLQSELWLFSTKRISEFIHGDLPLPPSPRLLVQHAVIPKALQYNSYGAVITKAQWSSDSRSILFLAEESGGQQRMFRVGIANRALTALTPTEINVEDFSEAGGTAVFSAKSAATTRRNALPGIQINGDAAVVTGLSLPDILFPNRYKDSGSPELPRDLWVKRGTRLTRINPIRGDGAWHFPESAAVQFPPAVSPDGSAFIAAKPAAQIPTAWTGFQFASDKYRFEKLDIKHDPSGLIWSWPWQYVYVNPSRHEVFPLVDAPSAVQAGYYDPFLAKWSSDGRRVLVTSTYLPTQSAKKGESLPCAVAVFTVADRGTSCVAYTRFPQSNVHLESASFGPTSRDVVVLWTSTGRTLREAFHEVNGTWARNVNPATHPKKSVELRAFLKQDINQLPTLWAAETASGKSREIWNPNPQLSQIIRGTASVYRWRDSTGYDWSAGLVLPPDFTQRHRYPLVIQTHGFFSEHEFLLDGAYTTGFAAQALASAGMVVLQMGDRTDRHIRPATEEASMMGLAFQSAIEHLSADGLIDPRAVGIIGFSRTSWYVEDALIRFPHMFKAATIIDGVDQSYTSYMLFCTEYRECRVDHESANGAPPFGERLATWLRSAPGFNLDRVQTPLRIEAIGATSILGEWETYSSLKLQRKPVDLVYLPNAQHILQKPLERLASQQANVDWFSFWLKGTIPAKSPFHDQEQSRWIAMVSPPPAEEPPH